MTRVAYLTTAALCFLSFILNAQTTWSGATDNDWNTATNWTNGLPASGNDATIPNGTTPSLTLTANTVFDYNIDNDGDLSIDLAGFNLNNNEDLVNSGILTLSGSGTFSNLDAISNSGTFTSNSIFTNSLTGILFNTSVFTFNGTTINFGAITNTTGTITLNADFDNGGTINNQANATLNNDANFDNLSGEIINNAGTIVNQSAGNWSNFGELNVSGIYQNMGISLNDGAGTLNVLTGGTVLNGNRFTNQNTISNEGSFENTNCSTFTGQNGSSSTNTNGGNFTNDGIIYQLGNAVIETTSGTGTTFTDQASFPAPDMICFPNITVDLDNTGNYNLSINEIDNGSSAGYCPPFTLSLSTTNFNCDSIGTRTVILTGTDGFGTPNTCQTQVEVRDNTAPNVICPSDIVINLNPGDCNDPINYTITGSDNCDFTITQTDGTGLSSGDVFPNGTTLQSYEVADAGMTTNCSFDVTVSGAEESDVALICHNQLNVSIAADCSYTFDVNTILTGSTVVCEDNYFIEINGQQFTTVDETFIGQNLMVSVVSVETGNSCWGSALIEDKLAPEIQDCDDITLNCLQNSAPISEGGEVPDPTFSDCSEFTASYQDDAVIGSCVDAYSRIITRTWTAVDSYGRTSTCEQIITIERIDLTTNPPQCPADYSTECIAGQTADTSPAITGSPTITVNGQTYTINEGFDNVCDITAMYTDVNVGACDGSLQVMRNWSIFAECVGVSNPFTCTQMISITDNTPPTITTPADFTVTVGNDCAATFTIPPATASDCSNNINWTTQYSAGQFSGNGSPFPVTGLTIGTETVIYTATDACGNTSTDTLIITIIDEIPPTVVCDGDLVVVLSSGFGQVAATSFDMGSTDNCCIDSILIARMENNCGMSEDLLFDEEVTFCCADVGQETMVILKVVDCYGNENTCMAPVTVEDKVDPVIVCPPDKTIDCTLDPTDFAVTGEAFASDNCGTVNLTHEDQGTIACDGGMIIRTFTAIDNYDNSASCMQTITVLAPDLLSENDIICPDNYEATGCTPNTSPLVTGEPIINAPDCVEFTVDFTDEVFPGFGTYCQKITRTWTITDICIYDGNPANGGFFQCVQSIFISNSDAPVLSCPSDLEFCSTPGECFAEDLDLTITYSDDCTATEDLLVFWTVDLNDDDVADSGILASGVGLNTANDYPIGTHEITYTVKDVCGTAGTCSFLFTVNDCQTPAIDCPVGISIELAQNTIVHLMGSQINLSDASNGCGSTSDLTTSFSSDINDTIRTYSCSDVGIESTLTIFVTNASGNQGSCTTTINVQDNMNACPSNMRIAGTITTESGQTVEEVMVEIMGESMEETMTDEIGHYEYEQGNFGENYSLTPHSGTDWLNGVTTWDIVKIRRHILNTEPLTSPYLLIAADINNSGSVTTADAIALRSFILQLTDEFPNNHAWRYVDANYAFPEPLNPWAEEFPEALSLEELATDAMQNDFIAVKIGDLNETAVTNGFSGNQSEERNDDILKIKTQEQELKSGEEITLEFSLENIEKIYAYQMTLNFDMEALEFLSLQVGSNYQRNNFGMKLLDEGAITCSWDKTLADASNANSSYFSVSFRAKAAVTVSKVLNLSSRFTPAVAYNETGEVYDIQLDFVNQAGLTIPSDNFALYQNRPNPFRTTSVIGFNLPHAEEVNLRIYDVSGKVLREFALSAISGYNEISIEAGQLPKGVLYYELSTPTHQASKKMILTR